MDQIDDKENEHGKILNKCGAETDDLSADPRDNLSKLEAIHEINDWKKSQTHDETETNSDDSAGGDDSDDISSFYSGKQFLFLFQTIFNIHLSVTHKIQ